ncbi:MAG: CRISPR-associated endonuclease Cas2 [Phycisphaerales bacterium]|nr:CRISPR-associated endonuclease Cas2 [Phycisphaerales bacterium]
MSWLLVCYDLPTVTKEEKRIANQFRKEIRKDGFSMFQFSMYVRYCLSPENKKTHIERVIKLLPEKGQIGIIELTDHHFQNFIYFKDRELTPRTPVLQQLELF